MRKRASGRISVTRPSNSRSSSFATLRSFRLAGPTRRALLAVAPRWAAAALQEGDGLDAGVARLMAAALLMGIVLVPVPILAMGRRPGGGVLGRRRLRT